MDKQRVLSADVVAVRKCSGFALTTRPTLLCADGKVCLICPKTGGLQGVSVCPTTGRLQGVSVCPTTGRLQGVSVCPTTGRLQGVSVCPTTGRLQGVSK